MKKQKEVKVERIILDSYLAVIENSVGSKMFKNFYVRVNGRKKDAMRDGWLSCALYLSSILYLFGLLKGVHGTVDSTLKDLEKSGWEKIKRPRKGSVVVWEALDYNSNGIVSRHRHIGFYVGKDTAISNDSWKKHPVKHPWTFGGKRKIEMILWNPKLK